jgi:hypothetical protein
VDLVPRYRPELNGDPTGPGYGSEILVAYCSLGVLFE